MENRALFIAFLVTWLLHVVAVHGYACRKRLDQLVVVLSHAAPSLVAIQMAQIFLLDGGATVAQFVAGSERGMNLWAMWANLWPLLLLATFVAGSAQVVWLLVLSARGGARPWLPVALAGTAMCAFSFLTVACNFPSA